jgi:hypothetical protein
MNLVSVLIAPAVVYFSVGEGGLHPAAADDRARGDRDHRRRGGGVQAAFDHDRRHAPAESTVG